MSDAPAADGAPAPPVEGLDRLGAFASGLCAVHCGLSALLPASLGVLGLGALLGQEAEWAFTITAVVLASAALGLGWRRHRSAQVALVLALGIGALMASRAIEMGGHGHEHGAHHAEPTPAEADRGHDGGGADELHGSGLSAHALGTVVGVLGGLSLIGGHLLNLRASRRARHACGAVAAGS